MIASDVFTIANLLTIPMWVLMIFIPKWKVTRLLIKFKVVPILLSIIYVVYIIQSLLSGPSMDFSRLESVMTLFAVENAVLAGWVHYLAFDLLVGMWILDKNKYLKIHSVIIAPCLIATFMLGPIGFLLFMGLIAFKNKSHEIH